MKKYLLQNSKTILSALVMASFSAAFFVYYILFKNKTFYAFQDNVDQFYTWYQKLAVGVHSGYLPIWDKGTASGHSFVGELQTGVFYPINILWVKLFGSSGGIDLIWLEALVILHFFIGALGLYLLARSFKVNHVFSVAAGLVFAYSGVMAMRSVSQTCIFFGLALIPYAVYFYKRYLDTRARKWIAVSGLFLGLNILAGHIQPVFHAGLILMVFAIFSVQNRNLKELKENLLGVLSATLIAILVALPQLFLSAQYLSLAYRFAGEPTPVAPGDKITYTTFSDHFTIGPEGIMSILNPQAFAVSDGNELYIGLLPLLLIILAAALYWRDYTKFFGLYGVAIAVTIVFALLAAMGSWTFVSAILYKIPLMSQVRELGRYGIMIHVMLCLLFAGALQVAYSQLRGLAKQGIKSRAFYILLSVGAFTTLNGVFLVLRPGEVSRMWALQLLIAGVGVLLWAAVSFRRQDTVWKYGVSGLVIASTALNGYWYIPHQNVSPKYPAVYYKKTSAITYLEQNCQDNRTLILNDALPVNIANVYQKIETKGGYGATMHKNYYDFILQDSDLDSVQNQLLGIKCVVAKEPLPGVDWAPVHIDTDRGISVYQNPAALPRVFKTAQPGTGVESVQVIDNTDYKLTYRVNVRDQGEYAMSHLYYPGWQVKVDGQAVPKQPYEYNGVKIFPKFTLSPGEHTVSYVYRPFTYLK